MIKALKSKGRLLIVHACGKDPGSEIINKIWPDENSFPSLAKEIIIYLKKNLSKKKLNDLEIQPVKKIKYRLRALPNEISDGISTSIVFSGWNAATYVNQINDIEILEAEKNNSYEQVTRSVIKKYKGLWFSNELLVIKKK